MKLGFLYAGQGSQHPGMGKDLYEAYPEFRAVYDHASVGFDLRTVSFQDPEGVLSRTEYTQPAMVAFAIGLTDVLSSRGIRPAMVAGLSLGEYSALYASGVFDQATALSTVTFRGQAMARAAEGIEASMVAVIGLERTLLEEAVREAQGEGVVVIANYNCPGQLVLGGEKAAVDKAVEGAKRRGARRCMPLRVSGPFHTPLMKKAGDDLRVRFREVTFRDPQVPVVFNVSGREKAPEETIPELLERQVQDSVYLEDSIRCMAEKGVDAFVEIGPGKVLSGFVRKTLGDCPVYPVESVEDVEALVSLLKGGF